MICQIFIVTLCVVYVSSIVFYDRKKKNIVKTGYCRANGYGSSKITCHAEELAIKYCRENDKKNKCDIYIWKYGKGGEIKTKYCCKTCTDLLKKYNMDRRIFTFENGMKVSALIDNPEVSFGNMIRRN